MVTIICPVLEMETVVAFDPMTAGSRPTFGLTSSPGGASTATAADAGFEVEDRLRFRFTTLGFAEERQKLNTWFLSDICRHR